MKKKFKVSSVSIRSRGHAIVYGAFGVEGLPQEALADFPFPSLPNTASVPVTHEEAKGFEPGRVYEVTFELAAGLPSKSVRRKK